MDIDDRDIVLAVIGLLTLLVGVVLGWLARSYAVRRRLRRKQAFFGLPGNSECLAVVNREAGGEGAVHRVDVFALLELAALTTECGAHTRIVQHDLAQQGFGERTEFCLGGPHANRRTAAHLQSFLPGVTVVTDAEPADQRGSFRIGEEVYRVDPGVSEYVLLARLAADGNARPVFLFCGQRAITHQAAIRYLVRHHEKLARTHSDRPFALLLKVVNSQAYGPDVVELVADVTKAAVGSPPPAPIRTKSGIPGRGRLRDRPTTHPRTRTDPDEVRP
ncbi:hypothetical protein [Streptomyces sp. NPDC060194]|uniref:hypothetical protein n=1 Tax=Streptomyces sp. NPDC060194 TaxID=3347069 RepID=UPI003664E856